MKKSIIGFLFPVFVFCLTGNGFSQPCLTFNQKSVDLDTMIQGEVKAALFQYENTGNQPLVIDRTRSSCGCTTVFSTKKTIAPGKGGDVKIEFSSLQFRGKKEKHVYVFSNDPLRPVDTLTIHVFVKSELDCTPRNLLFSNVKPGEKLTKSVGLYNPGDKVITITGLDSYEQYIRPQWNGRKKLMPGDTVEVPVHVTIPPGKDSKKSSVQVQMEGGVHPSPFSIRVYIMYEK